MDPIINQHDHRVNMPSTSHTQSPINLPSADLLADGSREDYNKFCVPLYNATITNDWVVAKKILSEYPELVRCSITESYETILHIAVLAKNKNFLPKNNTWGELFAEHLVGLIQKFLPKNNTRGELFVEHLVGLIQKFLPKNKRRELFVENLVGLMQKEDLVLQNKNHKTALFLAVEAGNVKMVDIMVKKNKAVLDIPNGQGMMPLYTAALHGSHSMMEYLYRSSMRMNGDAWTPESRGSVLLACAQAELFDVALKIVTDHPELIINKSLLRVLALKTDAFNSTINFMSKDIPKAVMQFFHAEEEPQAMTLLRKIWGEILKLPKAEVDDILRGSADPIKYEKGTTSKVEESNNAKTEYSSSVLFVAAEMGNTAFVFELIRRYPGLVWEVNDNNQSIFHIAVLHRHESLFKLIYEIGMFNDSIITLEDKNGNNMLHLVGILGERAKNNIAQGMPGMVHQIQRELLWFKEVEAILPHSFKQKKNLDGLTPEEVFNESHRDIISKGEQWLKETVAHLMVVATLIATITFAAAITFPGGYDQDSGNPVFLEKQYFTFFLLLDAFSFISALASIHGVLTIVTSRYTKYNFLFRLPNLLMLVMLTLYVSITFMFGTFSYIFILLYKNKPNWVPILIFVLLYSISVLTSLHFIFSRSPSTPLSPLSSPSKPKTKSD